MSTSPLSNFTPIPDLHRASCCFSRRRGHGRPITVRGKAAGGGRRVGLYAGECRHTASVTSATRERLDDGLTDAAEPRRYPPADVVEHRLDRSPDKPADKGCPGGCPVPETYLREVVRGANPAILAKSRRASRSSRQRSSLSLQPSASSSKGISLWTSASTSGEIRRRLANTVSAPTVTGPLSGNDLESAVSRSPPAHQSPETGTRPRRLRARVTTTFRSRSVS